MRSRSAVLAVVVAAAWLVAPPAATAQAADCGPMDVALVLDTTASMDAALDDLKAGIGGVTSAIETASGGDYRIGLITFDNEVQVRSAFVPGNKAAIDAVVPTLSGPTGTNLPEASDEAVHTAVRTLGVRPHQSGGFTAGWRSQATKAVVLVTDALPGGFDDLHGPADLASAQAAGQAAFDRGIRIHAVHPPNPADDPVAVGAVMAGYAGSTGGISVTGTEIADLITGVVTTCRRTDAFVRDAVADVGAEPGAVASQSPDISLCPGQVWCAPAAEVTADPGTGVFVHVRMSNAGGGTSVGVLKLYRSLFHGNGQWPLQWSQIGAVPVSVPAGGKTVVLPWASVVADQSFLVRWVSGSDPMAFAEGSGISFNVRSNNNVAWRRIVVNPEPG